MTSNAPWLVVGAGIVGLAVARELSRREPGRPVVVLEKEPGAGRHQTGRNSGVIHSGVYYPAGSEKARGCRDGIALMREFCERHGIERRRVGKVIAATTEDEFEGLERLHRQGTANGIPGLRLVGPDEMKEIEPAVWCLRALHLPEVEIVDYRKVCEALRGEVEEAGGEVRFHDRVVRVTEEDDGIRVETDRGEHRGHRLVNCAGLHCDRVARLSGCMTSVRIVPFRGEYYELRPEIARTVRGLVYPVPDPLFPFLGIHLTPMIDGRVTAGPNAVLALAREGYGWSHLSIRDVAEVLSFGGFWRMAVRHWETGAYETARSLLKPLFTRSVRKFLPGIASADMVPSVPGVRAQAVTHEGQLINDFLYRTQRRAVHILNAPSPAATASLSIAQRIADLARDLPG